MPDSVNRPKKRDGFAFQPVRIPAHDLARLHPHGATAPIESQDGGDFAGDIALDSICQEEVHPTLGDADAPQTSREHRDVLQPYLVRGQVFGCGQEVVATVRDRVVAAIHTDSPVDLQGLPTHLVATPDLLKLPIALQPWSSKLSTWAKTTVSARKKRPFTDSSWMGDHGVSISGPMLPEDYCAWFISVGLDPGPRKTDQGHTCLLLVAAPAEWKPGLQETLHGPFGEQYCVRLDALLMKVLPQWWEAHAYGALEDGALYFIPPEPTS